MSVLDSKTLLFEEKSIFVPELEVLKTVLQNGLKSNFEEVEVSITECPDLSQAPFHLSASGLSGDPTIVEFGGVPYLLPNVDRSRIYDIVSMTRNISGYEKKSFFTCGAGAGPWPLHNQNCEGMINLNVESDGKITNGTHIAKTITRENIEVEQVPQTETRCCLLGNLFLSEGKPGKVLKVSAKKRIGEENFITAMRTTLAKHFTDDKTVGLGGVFLLKAGKVKQHVMDDFSKVPLNSEEELNNWLTFHEMSSPLINLGTFVTNECDLDLRVQHFHSFSKHGEGGHYHYDTTPDIVEYEGYFNVGYRIVRIDKPIVTHSFGRD